MGTARQELLAIVEAHTQGDAANEGDDPDKKQK
jgi:hypothetical protein